MATRIIVTPELKTAKDLKPGDIYLAGNRVEEWKRSEEEGGDTNFAFLPYAGIVLRDPVGDENTNSPVTVFNLTPVEVQ